MRTYDFSPLSRSTVGFDHIFDLLPPKPAQAAVPDPEPPQPELQQPEPQGRNVHPVEMTDLSRLSIDHGCQP